ncbi:MAG: hypothetical protein K2X47_20555 [Bdellovibrionales bacterium]|nr:hypothetical protein [Bdellovibrionales bacterium]
MKTLKKIPLVPLLSGLAILVLLAAGYHWNHRREEGRAKIAAVQAKMESVKSEMLDLYKERVLQLEAWEAMVLKNGKNSALALSEMIKQSKELKVENQAEVERFDFVQNLVSEKVGQYIAADPNPGAVREMQKIEETINRKRREYHSEAFLIEDLNNQYRLKEVSPLVFPSERVLKEQNLFK